MYYIHERPELTQNHGLLFGIIEIIDREDVLFLCMLGHV